MIPMSLEQDTIKRTKLLPKWVIEHLIKLSEHADSAGFTLFEEKLAEATEALLEEINQKGLVPESLCGFAPMAGNNIIAFSTMGRRFEGKPV
jgi:hypothetical protein